MKGIEDESGKLAKGSSESGLDNSQKAGSKSKISKQAKSKNQEQENQQRATAAESLFGQAVNESEVLVEVVQEMADDISAHHASQIRDAVDGIPLAAFNKALVAMQSTPDRTEFFRSELRKRVSAFVPAISTGEAE